MSSSNLESFTVCRWMMSLSSIVSLSPQDIVLSYVGAMQIDEFGESSSAHVLYIALLAYCERVYGRVFSIG